MNSLKSEGGVTGGRCRSTESGFRLFVQTLTHLAAIHEQIELFKQPPRKFAHHDLARAQMKAEAAAVKRVAAAFNDINPMDPARDSDVLYAFSTGLCSSSDDGINAENAVEVGCALQVKLDGKTATSKMELKDCVKSLEVLRKSEPTTNAVLDSQKLHNRLALFAQRHETIEEALAYELSVQQSVTAISS